MANAPLGSPLRVGFFASLERRLESTTGRLLLASTLLLTSAPTTLGGCAPGAPEDEDEDADIGEDAVIGNGQKDWAQNEGQRNKSMVSYYGESWHHYTDCNTRAGCQGVDLFLKVRVKQMQHANLDQKRVGVVYRVPGEANPITAVGSYFTTWANGEEEWHVKVHLRSWQNIVAFDAWYQDGLGHTYYDDNGGELHAITIGGSAAAIQQLWSLRTAAVDDSGVHGKLAVRIADLDFDKELAVVWTTDGWATSQWSTTGAGPNDWHWVQDYGTDYEQWEIDLDIDAQDVERFEYAIVYRHAGSAQEAQSYEFWDNNFGQNYVLELP